jgi:hypothetical protein
MNGMNDIFEASEPELSRIAAAAMQQSRVSEIESARVEPRWGEIRDLLAAMGCEPVPPATGAGYRPSIAEDEGRPKRPPYW